MNRLLPTTAWAVVLFTVFHSAYASAQSKDSPDKAEDRNISGKWSGSFDVTLPDGKVQHNTAVLILKQNGNEIGGSIGESESKQSLIKDGKSDESGIMFKIEFDGGKSMAFRLHLEVDHLKGEASGETPNGKIVGKIDATRVKNQDNKVPPLTQALFKEISEMDRDLFGAFNTRDLERVKKFFTEDLEFYHDKEGLTGFQQNMSSFNRHFESPTKVRRELVDGTLEVHPLQGFGAVETGVHRFYSTEIGQKEKLTATAKFVHVWQKKDGQWKISRAISYDHN